MWIRVTVNTSFRRPMNPSPDAVCSTASGLPIWPRLTRLLGRDLYGNDGSGRRVAHDLQPRSTDFEPRAKSVIHLFMNGGPSQMDLFDPKEELTKRHGEDYFGRIAGDVEFPDAAGALMKSPFRFAQRGECGMWVSDAMPHFATQVDQVSIIRSMYTTNLTHEPALYKIHSGSEFIGRPSLGAWASYGLGTANQNLPAYVVLDDPLGLPVNGIDNWTSGYLPPLYQGTRFRATGAPVLDLKPDFDEPAAVTQLERDLIARLDRIHQSQRPERPQLAARISSYELAARMQLAATRCTRLISGNGRHAANVWHRPGGDRILRPTMPDRAPIDRARCAVCAVVHQQSDLGQS